MMHTLRHLQIKQSHILTPNNNPLWPRPSHAPPPPPHAPHRPWLPSLHHTHYLWCPPTPKTELYKRYQIKHIYLYHYQGYPDSKDTRSMENTSLALTRLVTHTQCTLHYQNYIRTTHEHLNKIHCKIASNIKSKTPSYIGNPLRLPNVYLTYTQPQLKYPTIPIYYTKGSFTPRQMSMRCLNKIGHLNHNHHLPIENHQL